MELKEVLGKVLEDIDSSKDISQINKKLKEFLKNTKESIQHKELDVGVFIGGSFAKGTLIKKNNYDVDVFLRFNKKYSEKEIQELSKKILNFTDVETVHGSRNYFKVKLEKNVEVEIVPVLRVTKPSQARNVTDLSYSHVLYIKKKIKRQSIIDGIKLAKAFCYAQKCYGAESYIKGFSGYSLELLVYYYGSFMNFLKKVSEIKDQEIIDLKKHYKNKQNVLIDLNSSKLNSPIILIDPTFKSRNALAGLSKETLQKFQKSARSFLRFPSLNSFKLKEVDIKKIKNYAEKSNFQFLDFEIKTDRQEGDIAGSKLLKFFNLVESEISRFFNIKKKEFIYENEKTAKGIFVISLKKEMIFPGPFLEDKKNVSRFKKVHKNTFEKNKRIYARGKPLASLKEFLENWKNKNKKIVLDMGIKEIKVNNTN